MIEKMVEQKKVQLAVPMKMYEQLEEEAKELGVTVPAVVKMGIRLYFENRAIVLQMGRDKSKTSE